MHISKQKAGGVALVIAIISFFSGMYYSGIGKTAEVTAGQAGGRQGGAFAGRGTQGGGMRGGAQGGFVNGEVAAMDETSMTIKMRDGSSKIVFYGKESVSVQKSVAGALSDIGTGTTVIITGKPNSDGSVTAESVQIRPAGSDRPRISN